MVRRAQIPGRYSPQRHDTAPNIFSIINAVSSQHTKMPITAQAHNIKRQMTVEVLQVTQEMWVSL